MSVHDTKVLISLEKKRGNANIPYYPIRKKKKINKKQQ